MCLGGLLTIAQTCRERKPPGLDPLVVLVPRRRRPARSHRLTLVPVVVVPRARAHRFMVARDHLLPVLIRRGLRAGRRLSSRAETSVSPARLPLRTRRAEDDASSLCMYRYDVSSLCMLCMDTYAMYGYNVSSSYAMYGYDV